MKRALLIAGGTVGGLGAVLAITPPQFTSSESTLAIGGANPALGGSSSSSGTTNTPSAAPATTSTATTKATPKASATTKATPKASAKATASAAATKSANTTTTQSATPSTSPTPAATKTTTTSSKNVSGTFTGDVVYVGYGNVQVQITVSNGKITDATALQAPSGRNQRWTDMAVPTLRQKTLAAQSANITGVSGASYTSYGWYKSLQSALAKAGL